MKFPNEPLEPGDHVLLLRGKRLLPGYGRWQGLRGKYVELVSAKGVSIYFGQNSVREIELVRKDPYYPKVEEPEWVTPTSYAEMIERLDER